MIGATIIAVMTFRAIPSWEAVENAAPRDGLGLIQPANDPALPWPGLFTRGSNRRAVLLDHEPAHGAAHLGGGKT